MSVSAEDITGVLNQPVLEDRVDEAVTTERRFREAFRDYDATNRSTRVIEIPVQQDEMDRPTVIAEGAEFPVTHENYNLNRIRFEKFGFEVGITREAEADSQVDLVQSQVDKQADKMADDMNRRAFESINDAVGANPVSDGSSDASMTFEDVLAGREALVSESYNPDLLIVDVKGVHDLMGGNNFLEASEMQGELRREGQVGRIAGMDVLEDDSAINISGNSDPGGLMVDTSDFGWEATRDTTTTEQYEKKETQEMRYRTFARKGWTVTRPEAGVIIEG